MTAGRDWDAATYDRISDPQLSWAQEQLSRLELRGDEVVLDAGCGSGRVTELLLDRVPHGRVYAVDAAPSMVAYTQERLGERVRAVCQDLVELVLPEPVDVIFSNATFHWIPEHARLFRRLYAALRPGGRMLAQCGGRGNIDAFRTLAESVAGEEPFAPYFTDWRKPWNYAGPEETLERLAEAGFADGEAWLVPRRVVIEEPRPFVRTVCLIRHLDPLPADLHERFLDEVLGGDRQPLVLNYVRLNMTAIRPEPGRSASGRRASGT